MKQNRTYGVTTYFYIMAENKEDAENTALHQSSEKYVQAPIQESVYSRKIGNTKKIGETPIIREQHINQKQCTFRLYKYLVPIVLTINAVNENAAKNEARKACRDYYHKFPIEKWTVSFSYEAPIGDQEIPHCQIITRWKIASIKRVASKKSVNLLPQKLIEVLPPLGEGEEAYAKYVEPVTNWTFYATSGDADNDLFGDETFTFYGLIIDKDGKREMREVGLEELEDFRRIMGTPVIRDRNFKPMLLSEM